MNHKIGAPFGSVDEAEIASFNKSAATWWDPEGESAWLHRYNPVRVGYIRDAACRQFGRDPKAADCLRALRILDIGCGAGVLCEPLAALGAEVIGTDPAESAIEVAILHARQTGLDIDYRATTAEALLEAGERFDVVLAMEVIEHVPDRDRFLRLCADLVRPPGLAILSTLNRTSKSYWQAIVIGEYILRILPPGTHQWERFVTPDEMETTLADKGLRTVDVSGVTFSLWRRALQISGDAAINYILTANRPAPANP